LVNEVLEVDNTGKLINSILIKRDNADVYFSVEIVGLYQINNELIFIE